MISRWCVLLVTVWLVGCSSQPKSRYSIQHDHGPANPVDVSHVKDAVPKVEPRSPGGNKSPYQVFGKTYHVLADANGYRKRGGASWYGKKFHGHQTSNGEVYDMYKMTAAHKSLPIPSYVRVTNLANGRQVIVRVNDRGPFHAGRIIDLSYAAAAKLDMLRHGTAQVEVEVLDPRRWQSSQAVLAAGQAALPAGQYLQVGAYALRSTADRVARQVQSLLDAPTHSVARVRAGLTLYRVLAGPLPAADRAAHWQALLHPYGYQDAHLVDFP